jgi:PTH2 family peptidyl-tRNA hydrolase
MEETNTLPKPENIRTYKQVILIRADLGIDCGKKTVQVAHASVEGFIKGTSANKEMWRCNGMRKIVLKVKDCAQLTEITKKATESEIKFRIITDAGLTQLEPGTVTSVGFEPLPVDDPKCVKLTELTKDLKLL